MSDSNKKTRGINMDKIIKLDEKYIAISSYVLKQVENIAKEKEIIEFFGENARIILVATFLCILVRIIYKEDWEKGERFLTFCAETFSESFGDTHCAEKAAAVNKYFEEKGITIQ